MKSKFVLTEDLIKVEPEPRAEPIVSGKRNLSVVPPESKERITVNIDATLKKDLQIYCVHNRCQMTEIVEQLVRDFLKENNIFSPK